MIKYSFLKNKIIVIVGLFISILFIIGCAAIGTKTIYKSSELNSFSFNKIGYSQPASEKTLNKIRPNTSKIYQSAFKEFFTNKSIKIKKYDLANFESIDKIDTSEISKICTENNIDGYICTQITYKFVDNYYMYIPLGRSEDAYVEMKLYNNKGILVLQTKHNTSAGNSYMMPPKAEQTIRDGTIGALKRIYKEIEKRTDLK